MKFGSPFSSSKKKQKTSQPLSSQWQEGDDENGLEVTDPTISTIPVGSPQPPPEDLEADSAKLGDDYYPSPSSSRVSHMSSGVTTNYYSRTRTFNSIYGHTSIQSDPSATAVSHSTGGSESVSPSNQSVFSELRADKSYEDNNNNHKSNSPTSKTKTTTPKNYFQAAAKPDEEEATIQESMSPQYQNQGAFHPAHSKPRYRRLLLLSNVFFVIGSALYLTIAIDDLHWSKEAQEIPTNVLYADDDVTWMEYRASQQEGEASGATELPATSTVEAETSPNNRSRKLILYEDYTFAELPMDVQAAAEMLGYNEQSWDNNEVVYTDELSWSQLTPDQRKAARTLGYTQATWNSEVLVAAGEDEKGNANGNSNNNSNNNGNNNENTGNANNNDDKEDEDGNSNNNNNEEDADTDPPDNNEGISAETGFIGTEPETTEETYDEEENFGRPLPDLRWTETMWVDLPPPVRFAAQVLEYTADLWNNQWPPLLVTRSDPDWNELTLKQRQAAMSLGYTSETWWYIGNNMHTIKIPTTGDNEGDDDDTMVDVGGPVLEWETYEWGDLPIEVQEAYGILGWNMNLWESGGKAETDELMWDELTILQQEAALFLGYTQATWDAEFGFAANMTITLSASMSKWDDYDWEELPTEIQQAYAHLGYTEEIWNSGGSVPAEDLSWDELTLSQQAAATTIGYTKETWDGDASENAPIASISANSTATSPSQQQDSSPAAVWENYDWDELPDNIQLAFRALGYTESSWDNNESVPTDDMEWSELTPAQQEAARTIGYTAESWDMETPLAASSFVNQDDDYIFLVASNQVWVSRYMILYFAAAYCFLFVGLIDWCRERKFFHINMIMAGLFGLISAMLVEKNRTASMACNLVSVHFFLLEGLNIIWLRLKNRQNRKLRQSGTFVNRSSSSSESEEDIEPNTSILSGLWWIPTAMLVADAAFVVGAFMDVVLSYFYFDRSSDWNVALARVFAFSTLLWMLTSVLYLLVTLVLEFGWFPCCVGGDKYFLKQGVILDPRQKELADMNFVAPIPRSSTYSSYDDGKSTNVY